MMRIKHLLSVFSIVLLAGCVVIDPQDNRGATAEPPAEPAGVGAYKVGNPYQVNGVWYYPAEDYNYDVVGWSSWYGDEFDGKPTANGEDFDMNALTGAHKTLPLPTIARLTNLDNNRSVVIRINDRGPFVRDRLIDVSRRVSRELDFEHTGLARVRLQVLESESRQAQAYAKQGVKPPQTFTQSASIAPVAQETLKFVPGVGNEESAAILAAQQKAADARPVPIRTEPVAEPVAEPARDLSDETAAKEPAVVDTGIYVQVGAFSVPENAERLGNDLKSYGDVVISPLKKGTTTLDRVRVGPLKDTNAAERMRDELVTDGYRESTIIFEY
ncbi:MAG: septal ring lytic transglycosylase RlpA family protein [Alphaproteobacteria bacterium]